MKTTRIVLAIALLAVAALVYTAAPLCAGSGCGFLPMKPFVPFGCKDLKPECACDERGANCKWRWICVK